VLFGLGRRSILGDQPGHSRYLIVQSTGEIRLRYGTTARRIASKSGDRAAVVDGVAMSLG